MTSLANQILLDHESRAWRRRLGPLPWAILEELAHQARPSDDGWIAPVGVRDLGTVLGVTKDTAARALATLRSARLVTPARAQTSNGHSRPGYQLNLPYGITIRGCPDNDDSAQHRDGTCPNAEDTRCPEGEYASAPSHHPPRARPAQRHSSKSQPVRTKGPAPTVQPSLFASLPIAD